MEVVEFLGFWGFDPLGGFGGTGRMGFLFGFGRGLEEGGLLGGTGEFEAGAAGRAGLVEEIPSLGARRAFRSRNLGSAG